MNDVDLCLEVVKVASHSPLNISETVFEAWLQRFQSNGLWRVEWSRDRWRQWQWMVKFV